MRIYEGEEEEDGQWRIEEVKTQVVKTQEGLDVDENGEVKRTMTKMELPECFEIRASDHYVNDYQDRSGAYHGVVTFHLLDEVGDEMKSIKVNFFWSPVTHMWENYNLYMDKLQEDSGTTPKKCSRFANKRWKVWWRRQQTERYMEISCLEGRREFMWARTNTEIDLAFYMTKNLKTKGAYYMIQRWKIPQRMIYERSVRQRYQELRAFEYHSLNWSFPKWCHIDKDHPTLVDYYNAEDYFELRKKATRSRLPEKVRCFGGFFSKSQSMPYCVEDKEGKPLPGNKQTWIPGGYKDLSMHIAKRAMKERNGIIPNNPLQ